MTPYTCPSCSRRWTPENMAPHCEDCHKILTTIKAYAHPSLSLIDAFRQFTRERASAITQCMKWKHKAGVWYQRARDAEAKLTNTDGAWTTLDDLGPGFVLGQWDAGGYDDDHRWAVWSLHESDIYYFGRTPQAAIENAANNIRPEAHP